MKPEIEYDPEKLKKQLATGIKPITIAKNFGVCEATVLKWRKAEGCPLLKAPKRKVTPEILQAFEELYKKGCMDSEIAHTTTFNQETVKRWRESKGYPRNEIPSRETFVRMCGEGCRDLDVLAKATGFKRAKPCVYEVIKEIEKEASKSEDPKAHYHRARERLKYLNSNRTNRGALKCILK